MGLNPRGFDRSSRSHVRRSADPPLVFDRTSGTLDSVYRFLDTIECPRFKYKDVLSCWAEMVGPEWIADDPSPRPAPPIPARSELKRRPEPPPSPSLQEVADYSDDTDSDSAEELAPPAAEERRPRRDRPWTADEDAALVRAIGTYGWGPWKQMALCEPALHGREGRLIASHVQWLQKSGKYGDLKGPR
jgi:hypothetical protein